MISFKDLMLGKAALTSLMVGALVCALSSQNFAQSVFKSQKTWFEGSDVGWSWYKDPVKNRHPKKLANGRQDHSQGELKERKNSAQDNAKGGTKDGYVYTRQMETIRKDFEEAVAKTVISPSLENVRQAQHLHNLIINRSTKFQDFWMLASLLSGEAHRQSDQNSPLHRKIYQEQEDHQLEQDIRSLSKTHGLFFIFKKECRYCHEMAPAVKQLKEQYGFNIKAISPDGEPIEGFEDAVKDNGTISKINPEGIFPIVFLINPHSGQTIPLTRGLTSPSEVKENFKVIIKYLKEHLNA